MTSLGARNDECGRFFFFFVFFASNVSEWSGVEWSGERVGRYVHAKGG